MKKLIYFTILFLMLAMTANSCGNCCNETDKCAANTADAVIENIMTRSSVRQFTDRAIAADTLESILKAGMAAPTAMNMQPWALVAVTEREVLDSLMAVHPYSNLKTAAAAVIVCGNMEQALEGLAQEYWVQDCSAVSENILLAAHAYGLGAVWCGVYPMPERIPGVKSVLGLPEHIVPLNIIAMGYPAGEQTPRDKWDPEKVHYQRW